MDPVAIPKLPVEVAEAQEAARDRERAFLASVVSAVPPLIKDMEDPEVPQVFSIVRQWLKKARRIAYAALHFPIIDVNVFSQVKESVIPVTDRNSRKEVKVFVPVFAQTTWNSSIRVTNHLPMPSFPYSGELNREGVDHNMKMLHEAFGPEVYQQYEILAAPPRLPRAVAARARALEPLFDSLDLVWEAEWASAPVRDPLLIGSFLCENLHFFVDQFDMTKLERYVASEFVTKS
jgi:hypothetical protein